MRPSSNATKPRRKTKASSPGPSNVPQGKPSSKHVPASQLDSDGDNDVVVDAKPTPNVSKPRSKATSQKDQKGQEKTTSSKSTKKLPAPDDTMEMDVQPTMTSHLTTARTSNLDSSSELKGRKELDRWRQKAKDVLFSIHTFVVWSLMT